MSVDYKLVEQRTFVGGYYTRVVVNVTGPIKATEIPVSVFLPAKGEPHSLIVFIDHRDAITDESNQSFDYFPLDQLMDNHIGIAVFRVENVAPDHRYMYRSQVINCFYSCDLELLDDSGRAIGAWSWAASRVLEYLQTNQAVQTDHFAVMGHSRAGKAALWAGAQDSRFATVIANNTGCTGVKLARRLRGENAVGEDIATINRRFPHWFAANYQYYDNNESALPVDQHELLALIAPRKLYVGSAIQDFNSDPKGELLGVQAATPVFDLYGFDNRAITELRWQPVPDVVHAGDCISYHLRRGEHDLTNADWSVYINGLIRSS